jgi:hypothetical protein
MELNDNEFSSDWLREMMTKTASTASTASTIKNEAKPVFKIHPISNFKCYQNPIRMTTNDGNKSQKCMNCNWSVTYE